MHHPKRGTCYRGVLTALFYQAMAPPPSLRKEGVGRVLVSPHRAEVEGHEVLGTREAEARSRQALTWVSISGQYETIIQIIFIFMLYERAPCQILHIGS